MKTLIKFTAVLLILALCFGLFIVYEQLPKPTYRLEKPPVLLTSEVAPGSYLMWINDICKLHNSDFYVERILHDLNGKRDYTIDITNKADPNSATLASLRQNECRTSEIKQLIPIDQPPGEYTLITKVFVKANRFSIDKFEYSVGPFEITKIFP